MPHLSAFSSSRRSFVCSLAAALAVVLLTPQLRAADAASATTTTPVTSFYEIPVKTLEGKPGDLAQYKGKVALVVNVASKCGFTKQYTGLEALYNEDKDKGFVILGFPANDFGSQEPGTAEEIRTFCSTKYTVTFPLFEKVVTKATPEQSPVYKFLGSDGRGLPKWNFHKYLIGKDGKVIAEYPSKVTPEDPQLKADIAKALAATP